MNGQLSDHPVAELVREIADKNLSGALRIRNDRVKVVVYCQDGTVNYAASNVRKMRLAEYLRKGGLLSDQQLNAMGDAGPDLNAAAQLVDQGILNRPTLNEVLLQQVTDVLCLALVWDGGDWALDVRARLQNDVGTRLDTAPLLLATARRLDDNYVATRLARGNQLISPGRTPPDTLTLSSAEGFLLSRVQSPVNITELITASGLNTIEARQAIYALLLAGVLKRPGWPMALGSLISTSARSTPVFREAQTVAESADETTSKSQQTRPSEEEIRALFARLSGATNHYEVLGIDMPVDLRGIKTAYYALARRFHPDRFHDLANSPLHERIEAAFARITRSYETLVDAELRSAYDAKLAERPWDQTAPMAGQRSEIPVEGEAQPSAPTPEQERERAEARFQEGVVALEQGQTKVALSCFSLAAGMFPKQARYRAYYGRALAANPKSRRLAENELQAAIKYDAGNASYRVWLAELYRELGFQKRARGELERALTINPRNREALALLQNLGHKKP
jgi:curved DNA-binding protein CbpA